MLRVTYASAVPSPSLDVSSPSARGRVLADYGLAMSLHQALPDNVHSSDVSDSAFRH
jgi:hypothetical protein